MVLVEIRQNSWSKALEEDKEEEDKEEEDGDEELGDVGVQGWCVGAAWGCGGGGGWSGEGWGMRAVGSGWGMEGELSKQVSSWLSHSSHRRAALGSDRAPPIPSVLSSCVPRDPIHPTSPNNRGHAGAANL